MRQSTVLARWSDLTLKERKVLELAAIGTSREHIADHPEIELSIHTINKMLSNGKSRNSIYSKIGVCSFHEAISWFHQAKAAEEAKIHKPPWLFAGADILQMEAEFANGEIWIVTPHLMNDTGTIYETVPDGLSTIDVVVRNLQRGIKYKFVVADTHRIHALLQQLRQIYGQYSENVTIITISEELLRQITISELAIYNPRMEHRQLAEVYMELPVSEPHFHWIKITEDIAYEIVARVSKIIDAG